MKKRPQCDFQVGNLKSAPYLQPLVGVGQGMCGVMLDRSLINRPPGVGGELRMSGVMLTLMELC